MKLPSKNVKNHTIFHNSVRPDPAAPGPRKLRVVFPVISVLPKPPQLPYGATYFVSAVFSVFPVFPLLDPRIGLDAIVQRRCVPAMRAPFLGEGSHLWRNGAIISPPVNKSPPPPLRTQLFIS